MIKLLLYIFTGINLLIYLYIIFAVAKKWKVSMAHKSFLFLLVFVFLWILIRTLESFWVDFFDQLFHLDFALAAMVAGAITVFALHYPKENINLSLKRIIFIQIPILIIAVLSFTDVFVYTTGFREIHYNFSYYIYITILIIYFIGVTGINLLKKYFRNYGVERQQLIYIIIGYLTAIIVLLFDSIRSSFIGPIQEEIDLFFINGSVLFSFFVAYAMLRYRFMDIRVVIRKGLIYGISLVAALAVYTYIALTLKSAIDESWNVHPTWTAAILIALVALGFPPLKKLVEKSINTLFKGKKSIDLAVKEVREKVAHETDFEKLVRMVSEEVKKFLEVDKVRLYLINHQEKKYIYESDGMKESIEIGNDLVRYFEKYSDVLVRDEVPHLMEEKEGKFEKERLQKAEKELKKRKVSLAMPLRTEEEVFGLLMLGEREKGQAYTIQDVKYLESLREQVGFTLANALLYKEAMARITANAV